MKKRIWSILLVLCMVLSLLPVNTFASDITIDDSSVRSFGGHSYQYYSIGMSWYEAKSCCESLGGHLVTITSQAEQNFINTFADNCMIGLSDDETEGEWKWVTGEPFAYSNWASGEPNNQGDEDYVLLNPDGTWNDGHLEQESWTFVCEWDFENWAQNDSFEPSGQADLNDPTEPSDETPSPSPTKPTPTPPEPTPAPTPTVLQPMKTDGTFKYVASHLKKQINSRTAEYTYYYDETWFEKNASEYQHDLAKMSLRMSMAGMAREDSTAAKNYANIEELLTKLEFTNLKPEYPKPEINSIGYYIGSKNLKGSDGKVYSLVSVTIRSANYYDEWGGNVTLGPSGNHAGFQIAANKTVTGIEEYVKTHKKQLTDNIKIWITGYSRGAATANLAAAKLNEVYGKNNVFAYCFECPMGANDPKANSTNYNNIFCIVNPIDLVPKVAMSSMGFSHYGNTYYLPSSSNTVLYSPLKLKMAQEYEKLLSYNGANNAIKDVVLLTRELAMGQSYFFDHFVNSLARNLGGRTNYYKYHESTFAPAVADLLGKDNEKTTETYIALLKLIGSDLLGGSFIDPTGGAMLGVEIATIAVNLANAHYPELCVAWLDSLDGKTLGNILTGYRTIYVNCPVDVSVYDSSRALVAKIVDDEPQTIENGITSFIDENGQKVFVLPMDMQYTIDVQATDDGTMTYTAADYDMDTGAYTQVVSYADIPIKDGDQLKGTASKTNLVTAEYTLKGTDGKALRPSVKETADQVQVWSVTTSAESGGTAEGGGVFVIGEYAKVTAAPEKGYHFIGWYDGKTKVSGDAEYRFAVKKDTALTAKFKKDTAQKNPFKDVKNDAYYYDAVLWAVNHDPVVTTGMDDTHFAPNKDCTRAQMVTFLWRAAGEPKPESTKNPFKDVKKGAYYYDAVLWAVGEGITTGTGKNTFSPEAKVTRAQTVTFLWRMANEPAVKAKNPFQDVKKGTYYYDAVLWAVANNITTGKTAKTFAPGDPCTRAQIVTFLYRDLG